MKKAILTTLILSLLLTALTACGAQAQQPQAQQPEPTPQENQTEPPKPVQLSEAEKAEISQEELEAIFENVYTTASENHPEDWSLDFQISDEVGKISKAIPEDKKAPANMREIYIEWRSAQLPSMDQGQEITAEPETESDIENDYSFNECNETVYAISAVNLRSGPGTEFEKVGGLKTGESVTRVGIGFGDCEGWSLVKLSDGSIVYVSSNYISTTKPAPKQANKPSGSQNSGGTTQSSSQNSDSQSNSGNSGGSQQSDNGGRSSLMDSDPIIPLTIEEMRESQRETKYKVAGTE